MNSLSSVRAVFRELHLHGCFVIPNPWDVGSALYLQSLGFKAIATTSAGFGFSRGLPDSVTALSRDQVLSHISEIAAAVDLPVNADFQSGYADDAAGVAQNVRLCIEAGVSGLSIEDATGDPGRPLFELSEAVERLSAARNAISASGQDVLLTARAECYLVGHPNPLEESIKRIQAYAEAGADVLFVPGPSVKSDLSALLDTAGSTPLNVIVTGNNGLTVSALAEMGVRRISVGSGLARTAWGGFMRAAELIAREGSFQGLEGAASFAEINGIFEGRSSADQ